MLKEQFEINLAKAYADCNSYPDMFRNLDWRSDVVVDADKAYELATEYIGGYNLFDPKVFKVLKEEMPNVGITLAREGSVCVYLVNVPEDYNVDSLYDKLQADEVDWVGGELRVWWD